MVRLIPLVAIILVALILSGCGSANQPMPSTANEGGDNHPPVIDKLISEYTAIERGGTGGVKCIAHDPDGNTLTYIWEANRGAISGDGSDVSYTAPTNYVDVIITCTVTDGRGNRAILPITFPVVCCSNATKNPEWPE